MRTSIRPHRSWKALQNGTNEFFNGKFRDECLSTEWFRNRIDAKIVIEQFRRQYNEVRPHSSLQQLTLAEFKQKLSSTNHPELAIS
ncbi:MAG: integrase core domain-containing protein [Acidiferrobacteraceae bacterium]